MNLQEQQKEDFMPEVGVECEFKATAIASASIDFDTDFEPCVPEYISSYGVVVTDKNGDQWFMDFIDYNVTFRPIKNQSEKRREEQIEKMYQIYGENMSGCASRTEFGRLYDAGFRMTREFTDADISSIAWGLSSSENKNEIKFACDVARAVIAAYVTGSGEYE